MQQGTSFLKRFIALVLTLVLLLSNANMGVALQAFAAESATKTVGQVMAENYELTETEAHLLEHGYIVGSEAAVNYSIPEDADNLIKVDTDNKKVSVETPTDWTVEKVEIVVGNEVKETVTLNASGEGTYTYGGNAFSVKAYYSLSKTIAGQEAIFAAIKSLKTDLANVDAVDSVVDTKIENEDGTTQAALDVVKEAIPVLTMLAEGFDVASDWGTIRFEFKTEEAKNAAGVLESQVDALKVLNDAFDASASKVQHLLEKGEEYKSVIVGLYNSLSAIDNDSMTTDSSLPQILKSKDAALAAAWNLFVDNLDTLVEGLSKATGSNDWTTVGKDIVNNGVNFVELDSLIYGLPETLTSVSDSKALLVDETTVQYNLSMFNVTVNVALMVVGDEVDSAELVRYGTKSVVLTLGEDATKAEILAEVEASGIVAEALAEWAEVYVDGKFDVKNTDLPATLTKDIDYTITYSPKSYTVTRDYAKELTVPYGYKLTLERHEEPTQAYDYFVNGKKTAQGQVVTIVEDTDITRKVGKAYTSTDLYTVVANNYGNDVVKAILTSGALNGNVAINYREPDPAEVEELLELINGTLTAQNYDSDYEGLSWNPYTYGENGTENTFSGSTASCDKEAKSVKARYILPFTNFGQAKAQEVLNLAAKLKTEAADQKSVMDSLAGLEDTLSQLDKTKLGALNGVIDVTDFTEGDNTDTDAENLEIRAELKSIVSNIIANNLDGNKLKIYNMVVAYNNDGMSYYYQNYAAIKAEVNSLAGYLTNLMDNEEALKIMCEAAGYGEYADKIADVEAKLNDYNARMIAPNSAINVNSGNLGKLVTALVAEGNAESTATGSPYVLSKILTALDESQVMVQVIIETPNGSAAVTSASVERGNALTQEQINELKEKVEAEANTLLAGNTKYYALTVEGTAVEDLAGKAVDNNINIYYTYEAKEYTVKIDGESNQTISINDLEINLPKHPVSGYRYEYTVDGIEEITTSTYTFTLEQIDRLFKDGSYTITRVEIDEVKERFETAFGDWIVYDKDGNIAGLKAEVDASKDGIMDFVMTIVNSGYTYIGMDGGDLLYMNDENTTEIKLQTLINALLNDEGFSSDRMIALGKDGKGVFLETKITIDDEKPAARAISRYMNLPFTLYLKSVPGQMATVSKGLEKVKPYMSFTAGGGVMNVELNLPEKIYEVYLTALLATGNVDKTDMNAINSEIAFQFLWDYVEEILATDADTTTYTNTLAQVGVNYDLTGAEDYYQMVKKALTNPGVVVNPEDNNEDVDISVTAKSQKAIDSLINLLGVDISAYETYLGMVYEYKYETAEITAAAKAVLKNTNKDFEAALIDLNAAGVTNKFDYTNNLPARVTTIADKAFIILLDDVDGDLVFDAGATILDLNGKNVNDDIIVNGGTLYIIDSTLNTTGAGEVKGTVSGNAKIFAGVYNNQNVTSFLPEGYKQVNGAVSNRLYTLETDEDNNTSVAISTDLLRNRNVDYFDFVKALAVDLAADLVLNNYTSAALSVKDKTLAKSVDYHDLYSINFDDLLALLNSTEKKADLVQKVIDSINIDEFDGFINDIIDDLLNFPAIKAAAESNGDLVKYEMVTHPFKVSVEHQLPEDYIEFGICANDKISKNFSISLKAALEADRDYIAKIADALDVVVSDDTDVNVTIDKVESKFVETHGVEIPVITGGADIYIDIDLTKETRWDYAAKIAEALGYASKDGLKAAIDAATAGKIIDKLEGYVDGSNKIEKGAAYVLNTLGKALRKLGVEDKAFGDFETEYGVYVLKADKTVASAFRGVFEDIEVNVYIRIKLFVEGAECEHVPGDPVRENEIPATCTTAGSYDEVVYCTKCGEELKRKTIPVVKTGHKWDNKDYTIVTDADCENDGLKIRTCTVCGCVEEVIIPALGHKYDNFVVFEPTCTEQGYTEYTCIVCGHSYKTDYTETVDHVDVDGDGDHLCDFGCGKVVTDCYDNDGDHYCDECGVNLGDCVDEDRDHFCDVCGDRISWCHDCDRDHICDWCGEVFSVCVDRNHNHICDICWKLLSVCADENDDHLCDYCLRIVSLCCDKNRDHLCDLCGRQISVCIDTDRDGYCDICGVELEWVIRLYGENRAQTARDAAEELKAILGVHKFDNIVYASGYNFPDALAGTYFANVMEAPVLMYFSGETAMNLKYIEENLAKDGTVYILGGTEAIPAPIEEELVAAGINVVRLGGETRFETNLEILDATGFDGGETVLVCAGYEFADALSASATGLPILLVNNAYTELRESQVEYLENLGEDCNFIIIGGTNAVSAELAAVIAEYDVDGEVERIGGATRFETSLMVAEKFFPDADQAILAYAWMFPDALCGGTIGYALGAPVILTSDVKIDLAADYMAKRDINSGYVMGGALRLSDEIVCIAFDLESAKDIHLR